MFNTFTTIGSSYNRVFKARELMSLNSKVAPFARVLTTNIIGKAHPMFTEQYGEGKPIDIEATFNHDAFLRGVPKAKKSGVAIDRNGNIRLILNLSFNLKVEDQLVRQLFAQVQLKLKVKQEGNDD